MARVTKDATQFQYHRFQDTPSAPEMHCDASCAHAIPHTNPATLARTTAFISSDNIFNDVPNVRVGLGMCASLFPLAQTAPR